MATTNQEVLEANIMEQEKQSCAAQKAEVLHNALMRIDDINISLRNLIGDIEGADSEPTPDNPIGRCCLSDLLNEDVEQVNDMCDSALSNIARLRSILF